MNSKVVAQTIVGLFLVCSSLLTAVAQDAPTPQKANLTANATASVLSASATIQNSSPAVDPIVQAIRTRMGEPNSPVEEPSQELITKVGDESIIQQIGRMLISLAIVISLALGLAWWAKKYFLKTKTLGGSHITVLSSYALSQKSKLHLVQVGNQTYLIGDGGSQITLLSKIQLESQEIPHETLEEMEELYADPQDTEESLQPNSFKNRLAEWQDSMENKDVQQEVRNSLLVLGGLSQRLSRKGEHKDG